MANGKKNESFIRWQSITITQLGYTINLILTLTLASLGFGTALLINQNFIPTGGGKVTFLLSMLALIISVILGVICIINRLKDFRKTAKIAKLRGKPNQESYVNELRLSTKKLGANTWIFFYWQVGFLFLGVALLIVTIGLTYIEKLF